MEKIYVLLMHTNTIPSKIVRLFTNYEYSHVAISLDKSCSTLYSFGRKKLNNALEGGFTRETKTGEFFAFFNKTQCKIYEIEVTNKQYKNIKQTIEKMHKDSNKYKYDFLGIGFRFFNIPITFKNRYVCSYFIADILEKNDIHKFNKKTSFVRPKDFDNILKSKLIYEGIYNNYE